jgi:hypothetical protein
MSEATTGQLIGAGTAILSGALGLLGGVLIEHLRTRGDRAARTEARQDERDDFQRQTLLELQEAIARYGRLVGQLHHHDTMAFKQTGDWAKTRLGADLDEDFRSAQVQLRLLAERVRDDELRPLVYGFSNRGVLVGMATSQGQATERMDDWMASMIKLQDRLGSVLRSFL